MKDRYENDGTRSNLDHYLVLMAQSGARPSPIKAGFFERA